MPACAAAPARVASVSKAVIAASFRRPRPLPRAAILFAALCRSLPLGEKWSFWQRKNFGAQHLAARRGVSKTRDPLREGVQFEEQFGLQGGQNLPRDSGQCRPRLFL